MATVSYAVFARLLDRCAEVAAELGSAGAVKAVFDDRLAAEARRFTDAHAAVYRAEKAREKDRAEASSALAALDRPYRATRSVVLAYDAHAAVPETLKDATTDTDEKHAIESLLHALDDHHDQPWAARELAGVFATDAPAVLREIDESIASDKALSAARDARAAAFGVAYERYLAFKNVVRQALGAHSPQYRRIHVRRTGTLEPESAAAPREASATTPAV